MEAVQPTKVERRAGVRWKERDGAASTPVPLVAVARSNDRLRPDQPVGIAVVIKPTMSGNLEASP
jgi:hypothetical protein